jgi:cell division protein FtsQ
MPKRKAPSVARGARRKPSRKLSTATRQPSVIRSMLKRGIIIASLLSLGAGWWLHHTGRLQDMAMDMGARYEREWYDSSELLGLVVNQIYLEGRERMPLQEAMLTIGVVEGDPILTVDVSEVKARLEETRWIERAEVQRSLPDTLHVRVYERRPLALWQHQGQLRLIDQHGAVIEGENVADYSYLPVVVGEQAPEKTHRLIQMLSVQPELFAQVSSAIHVGQRRWNIRLYNGKEILLPEDNAEVAWRKLVQLDAEKALLKRDVKRVDMRHEGRVYLQLTPAAVQRERLAEREI